MVIPAKIRKQLRIKPGDDFEVLTPDDTEDIVLRKVQKRANARLAELFRNAPRGLFVPPRKKGTARKPLL